MTPQDEQMIRQSRLERAEPAPTVALSSDQEGAGAILTSFCRRLKELVPGLAVKKEVPFAFPAPVLVVGRHLNIGYQVNPTGKMLAQFLEALGNGPARPIDITPRIDARIGKIDLPTVWKLYVAPQCPHCPQSIRQLQALAARSPFIRLRIIDAGMLAGQAQADQVRSVPTLILDDHLRWTGLVDMEELLTLCIQRDPARLSANSVRQLIESGDAARVSAMMTAAGKVFPALIELLVDELWSVRLGAMVTAEYLADEAPLLGLQLCQQLWEQFDRHSPQVQGDALQVLGQIDSEITRGCLRSVIAGGYDQEVRAAAAEVLEEMEGKRLEAGD
jgi:glutaredoxin